MERRFGDADRHDDVELDEADVRDASVAVLVRGERVAVESTDAAIRLLRAWVDDRSVSWRQVVSLARVEDATRLSRAEILERAARHLTAERRLLWSPAKTPGRSYTLPAGTEHEADPFGEPTEREHLWASFEMDAEPNDLVADIDTEYEPEEIDAAVEGEWEAEEIDAAADGEWEAEEIDAGADAEWEADEIDAGADAEWQGVEREDQQEMAQAATLQQAAQHGTPLCEECERLRQAEAAQESEEAA